jgi:hypothetical protein
MALTESQAALRLAFIEDASRRHPRDYGAAMREGIARFKVAQREGIREAMAVDTTTNPLNGPNFANDQDDVGGNSFEAFLAEIIGLIAAKAAADGKTNPAYSKLAAQLALAQATSSGGVKRGSFVSPAAGSTPTGRTESAASARFITEALTLAAMHLPPQQGTVPAAAVPVKVKALEDMSMQELAREHAARLSVLASEGALRSPIYQPVG